MTRKSGFTIVEIAVVIVIISVLATLTIIAYNRVQANARNDSSKSKATIISEALEKYYEKNGNYPACTQLSGTVSTVISSYLQGLDPNIVTRAGSQAGTNSIDCSTDPNTSKFTYNGNADTYELKYQEELTGDIVVFNSRHKPPSSAPTVPIISLAYNSSTGKAVANASSVPCTSGSTLYSFRQSTNGAWAAYGAFASSSTAETTPSAGNKYNFQVRVQCTGNAAIETSAVSNSYIHPVNIVSNPTISVNLSSDQSSATMQSIVCPDSTVPNNRIQSRTRATNSTTNFDAWSVYSATTINTSRYIEQGWQNTFRGEAFCDGAQADSQTVSTAEVSVVRPMSQPVAPTWSGTPFFYSGDNKSKPAWADFTYSCSPGAWRSAATFDSYPQWKSEHWIHDFPYYDWWYTGRSTTQYVRYYARYACSTDFWATTSLEGTALIEVRP